MGKLVIMDRSGHAEVDFKADDAASIKVATERFNELVGKGGGHMAYRIGADGTKEQIRSFDKSAEEILVHPQLVGG